MSDFSSFEKYCQEKYGFQGLKVSAQQRFLDKLQVVELSVISSQELPVSSSQEDPVSSSEEDSFYKALCIVLCERRHEKFKFEKFADLKKQIHDELSEKFERSLDSYKSWAQAAANVCSVDIEIVVSGSDKLDPFKSSSSCSSDRSTVFLRYVDGHPSCDPTFSALVSLADLDDIQQQVGQGELQWHSQYF